MLLSKATYMQHTLHIHLIISGNQTHDLVAELQKYER